MYHECPLSHHPAPCPGRKAGYSSKLCLLAGSMHSILSPPPPSHPSSFASFCLHDLEIESD